MLERLKDGKNGIISEAYTILMSSSSTGSGVCKWHWVDDNNTAETCVGSWDIAIKKITDAMPSIPLLLLDD